MWFGADGNASIERWYLSPYVEKPLNSKVIKSFVPELRSRVFCVSGFLCYMYICVMNILCTFHTYSCMGMLHSDSHQFHGLNHFKNFFKKHVLGQQSF